MTKHRRKVLGALALLTLAAPFAPSGCGVNFDPISKIEGLRVLAVVASEPYAQPGDDVTFKMSYEDINPDDPSGPPRKIQITWIGGCFDPDGDQYYNCYSSLEDLFASVKSGDTSNLQYFATGTGLETFKMKVPSDIITRRTKPSTGPWYGTAYVFFAACAGELKPVPQEGSGAAGSFPLGCFDAQGNQLGADSFVPGYTEIFSFEDGRTNNNPSITSVTVNGTETSEKSEIVVPVCGIDEETRKQNPGCSRSDPFQTCPEATIDVKVPSNVADYDPESLDANGNEQLEAVWVDYYVDNGDLSNDVKLVVDPTTGETSDHTVGYIGMPQPGTANLWVVLHDARGGAAIAHRKITSK